MLISHCVPVKPVATSQNSIRIVYRRITPANADGIMCRVPLTWHANASKCARVVQAASIILARMAFAFVDIRFAARPGKPLRAIACKRTGRIDAFAVVFARRALHAFVDVFGAIDAFVAGRTRARVRAIHRTRVANSVRVAWIRGARVVQMAQQTRFARNAAADEAADAIDARGPIETGRVRTIVDIDAAIGSGPAVHTNARVSADRIRARRPILADRWSRQALVDVTLTVFAREIRSTFATIRVHIVNAFATILT